MSDSITTAPAATVPGEPPAVHAISAAEGLRSGPPGHLVARGDQLAEATDADLAPLLVHGTVVARATPAVKHRLVQALQARGHLVAVTGDGANDAPALAAATLPGYLLLATTSTSGARAAAVLGWLAGHALIAWTLRTRPALSWRANPAFPAWAVTATAVALLAVLTPAGRVLHLSTPPGWTLAAVAAAITLAVGAAVIVGRLLRLPKQL